MENVLITDKFKLKKNVVEQQFDVLYSFTRSLAYYRAIHQDLSRLEKKYDFFCHTMNAHILKAITDWCMVFGSDSNEVQWKKSSLSHEEEFQIEIRNLIYESTGFSHQEWSAYREEMVNFRNVYVAHRNPEFKKPVPHMEKAFDISVAFFDWLKEQLWPSFNEPESLNILYPKFQIEALEVYGQFLKKI